MKGLFGKYYIEKSDGSQVDPGADYFVLRLDKDPNARHAARAYARTVRESNSALADDLEQRCDKYSLETTAESA